MVTTAVIMVTNYIVTVTTVSVIRPHGDGICPHGDAGLLFNVVMVMTVSILFMWEHE